jgi:hypothetical protein
MAHIINGFVARFRTPLNDARGARLGICPLQQEFGFLPVSRVLIEGDNESSELPYFRELTKGLQNWAVSESLFYPIAYVETEYFGGDGEQAAAVWEAGQITFGPLRTRTPEDTSPLLDGAINQALRMLGVVRVEAIDEFAALGLGRYRNNEDWIAAIDN